MSANPSFVPGHDGATYRQSHSAWPVRPIGELLKPVRRPIEVNAGDIYREIGIRSHCKGIFHKPPVTGEHIGNKRVFRVEPGCLVLNIIFAWEQAVAVTSEDETGMIASHRFPMYTSRNGKLLPEYAWRYFSSSRGKYDLGIASPGGAGRNKTLGQAEFNQLKIPVPPIAHQHFAVGTLTTADGAIARTEALIAAKHKLKGELAQRLLTGSLRRPSISLEEWKPVRISDLATILISGVDKKSKPGEAPVRLCNYTDIYYNDRIGLHCDFVRATASSAEIEKFWLRSGDVVITKDSETPDDIAKPAVVIEDMPQVLCGYHLAILRPQGGTVSGPFLAQLLRLPSVRHEFYRVSNGVTRFGLGRHAIGNLILELPGPAEQLRIATLLNSIDRHIDLLERKLSALRELKRGLMQRLFAEQPGRSRSLESGERTRA